MPAHGLAGRQLQLTPKAWRSAPRDGNNLPYKLILKVPRPIRMAQLRADFPSLIAVGNMPGAVTNWRAPGADHGFGLFVFFLV
jgi:hypothetical protein